MYLIISWDTHEPLDRSDDLKEAKQKCLAMGHTDEYDEDTGCFSPVAYVAERCESWRGKQALHRVYSPQFRRPNEADHA